MGGPTRLDPLAAGSIRRALTLTGVPAGASSDLQQATRLARAMVTKYGMSELLGNVSIDYEDQGRSLSPETRAAVETEVSSCETGHGCMYYHLPAAVPYTPHCCGACCRLPVQPVSSLACPVRHEAQVRSHCVPALHHQAKPCYKACMQCGAWLWVMTGTCSLNTAASSSVGSRPSLQRLGCCQPSCHGFAQPSLRPANQAALDNLLMCSCCR